MHLRKKNKRIPLPDILITLAALELMAFFYYGIAALWLGAVCVGISLVSDLMILRFRRKDFTVKDLYCISDGLIIALMLPAGIDWKIPAAACVFASIVKNIFGGRENMIFSPPGTAYIFMAASWATKLLAYPEPYTKLGIFGNPENLTESLSRQFNDSGKISATNYELLMGSFAGPMGAVSLLIIAVSAAVLIARKGISVPAFCGVIGGTAALGAIFPYMGTSLESVRGIFATNMTLFAAVYIVSDKRIAPQKWYLGLIYGILAAAVSYGLLMLTGKENSIISASVILTPAGPAMGKLSEKISLRGENAKGADEIEQ